MLMENVKVKGHKRKGKYVKPYTRKKRPKSNKRVTDKTPHKLYGVRDENGRLMGWSTKPPKKKQ
jgi:hypothetical protein